MRIWIWVSLGLVAGTLAVASAVSADNPGTNLDNAILALVLTKQYTNGDYVVVYPKSSLDAVQVADAEAIKSDFRIFRRSLDTNDVVALLVDRLFERNKMSGTRKAVQLTLASSPKDGYVVDYEGKYLQYLRNDGGSWPRFYRDNPKAQGLITLSLPAYDPRSGLVLVYKGTHRGGLQGCGEIVLYLYERGALKELHRTTVWIA